MALLDQLDQQVLLAQQERQERQVLQDRQVLQVQPLQFHTHTAPPQDKQHLAEQILTH
jgi:hypothetical protein